MSNFSTLLAWRYIVDKHKERSISTMAFICFIGISIGSFALALVICVMGGFETATYQKMRTMHAPLLMSAGGQPLNIETIAPILKEEFPEITAWSQRDTDNVIIRDEDDTLSTILVIKGVDPEKEGSITSLGSMITDTVTNNTHLPKLLTKNSILIGKKLASQLGIAIGDNIELLYTDPERITGKKITLQSKNAHVTGFFHTGIEEFDANLIISSLDFLHTMFGKKEVTQLGLAYQKNSDEKKLISDLSKRFRLEVISWKELYPALVAALTLEKYAMFLILALITLVASMNMMSLLFMFITRHRADIAILKAHGITSKQIQQIFLRIALGLSAVATVAGLAVAYAIGFLLDRYPIITLPDVYHVSHLPILLNPMYFVLVFFVSIALTLLAAIIPLRSTRNIKIAYVLAQEA